MRNLVRYVTALLCTVSHLLTSQTIQINKLVTIAICGCERKQFLITGNNAVQRTGVAARDIIIPQKA